MTEYICFKCRDFMKCVEDSARVENCEKLAKSLEKMVGVNVYTK